MHALFAPLLGLVMLFAPSGGWLGVYLAADRDQAVVTEVVPDSPAAKAGLRAGDVLIAVGDTATPTREKLVATIGAASPGDRVAIKLQRDGKDTVVAVRLGTRPSETAVTDTAPPAPARRGQRPPTPAPESVAAPVAPEPPKPPAAPQNPTAAGGVFLGLAITESDGKLMIDRVVEASPAAAAGLKAGEQLVSLGDRKLGSLTDLDRALRGVVAGKPIAIGLRSKDGVRSVSVTPAARGRGMVTEIETVARKPVAAAEAVPEPRRVRQNRRATAVAPQAGAQVAPPRASGIEVAPVRTRVRAGAQVPAQSEATDVEGELEALRRDLAELKKQLQELRKELRGKRK